MIVLRVPNVATPLDEQPILLRFKLPRYILEYILGFARQPK